MRFWSGIPLVILTACGVGTAKVAESDLNACLIETRAPGQYTLSKTEFAGSGAPAVFPAAGGTQAGAGLVQNCLARKANDGVTASEIANTGGLPLPIQYPLQAGDAELWPTLTRAQQERAMAFLADGSTIQASLKGDQ
jgi:hypothetical protein